MLGCCITYQAMMLRLAEHLFSIGSKPVVARPQILTGLVGPWHPAFAEKRMLPCAIMTYLTPQLCQITSFIFQRNLRRCPLKSNF